MNKITKELKSFKSWEVAWLLFANIVILAVSVYMGDTPIGIICSITGTCCVILTGMGKMSNFLFGTINVILYAYVAWNAKYYGEVMLNLLYYFPTNIIGFVAWKKHMNEEKNEVQMLRLTLKQDVMLALACVAGIFGYSYVLKLLGGNLPLIDSMSTVLSVVAQILLIRRRMEQWIIWIIVDVVTVIMWIAAFFNGGESVAVLMMWIVYTINAFIMFIKWYKGSKATEKGDK